MLAVEPYNADGRYVGPESTPSVWIEHDYGHAIHVHVQRRDVTGPRSAVQRALAYARRHYGGPVHTVSGGGNRADYRYVIVPRS